MKIKLYRHKLSGHAHRAELFLSLLNLESELIDVDLAAGEHRGDEFLKLNPFGQVPVLVDGDVTLADSNSILVYLASKYDQDWLPTDPAEQANVQRWLSVAAGELASGPAAARLVKVFNAPLDHEAAVAKAHKLLSLMETHLSTRSFLATSRASIADIAMYSYTAHAPEGEVSLESYPKVREWLSRIEALPNFTPMQKTLVAVS